jgi:hypothetical protein
MSDRYSGPPLASSRFKPIDGGSADVLRPVAGVNPKTTDFDPYGDGGWDR